MIVSLVVELTVSKTIDNFRHGIEILDEPASTVSDSVTDRHSAVSNEAVGSDVVSGQRQAEPALGNS